MIPRSAIKKAVAEFGMLRYFPSDPVVQAGVMALLERMVRTPEQLAWLVRTMIDEVGEWQGTKELRGVFCTRFAPADGVEADCAAGSRFSPEALEGRSAEEHDTSKFLGAGASIALLPAMEEKWETLPPEPKPDKKREPVTTRSEKEINNLLKKMGAA
jgi:hypothetical protein